MLPELKLVFILLSIVMFVGCLREGGFMSPAPMWGMTAIWWWTRLAKDSQQ